jgi:hypothetical protein
VVRLKQALVTLSLFLMVALVYYESPVHGIADSAFSLLMDEAILHEGTPDMRAYQVPHGQSLGYVNGYPWNIALVKGRLIYVFPWGSPLLTLPAVAAANSLGYAAAPKHIYNRDNEVLMQTVFTTLISALTVSLAYLTACSLLPISLSLGIALSEALGTQMWSSVSRSLWPQTWYLLLVTAIIFFLLRHSHRASLLATLIIWAGFVRPMAAPTLLVVGVYILFELKSPIERTVYVATGLLWAGVLGGLMLVFVGQLLAPAYSPNLMTTKGFVEHLAGILLSPGRGLLVYVPVVVVPLYLTARYWRHLPERSLATLALAAILTTILTLAFSRKWWGGHSYGPRDLAETIPWFSLLAILGIKAFLEDLDLSASRRRILIGTAVLLLMVSITMNAQSALSWSGENWNGAPEIDFHSDRLWDWRHPQFLAWLQEAASRRCAYLEQRREVAVNMQQEMLARGDAKAAQRLGRVIGQLNRELIGLSMVAWRTADSQDHR